MPAIDLRLGDCLEILPTLGRVDAVVADPPYGISYRNWGGGNGLAKRQKIGTLMSGDDRPFDPGPWLAFPCLLWGADHYAAILPGGGTWLAWDKSVGIGPANSFVDCEFAWCSIPGIKRNIFRCLWKGMLYKRTSQENGKKSHPTQKPVGLMKWCIEHMKLEPGATILDPYMGSGTTGVAAVHLGYNFVGIECHEPYFKIAERRIEAEMDRTALFGEQLA
jgi:site-specific DNA-methyltransferase (adenine-specific)